MCRNGPSIHVRHPWRPWSSVMCYRDFLKKKLKQFSICHRKLRKVIKWHISNIFLSTWIIFNPSGFSVPMVTWVLCGRHNHSQRINLNAVWCKVPKFTIILCLLLCLLFNHLQWKLSRDTQQWHEGENLIISESSLPLVQAQDHFIKQALPLWRNWMHCRVARRLQMLQENMIGGERSRDEEAKRRRQSRRKHVDERKQRLARAAKHDDDETILDVYDSVTDEVKARDKMIARQKKQVTFFWNFGALGG